MDIIEQGQFSLGLSKEEVFLSDEAEKFSLPFTPIERKLFVQLFRCLEKVQTREQLLAALNEANPKVSLRTVDMHMSKMRKKLLNTRLEILAIHGVGYRLSVRQEMPSSGLA